jgi:hypothetical protein
MDVRSTVVHDRCAKEGVSAHAIVSQSTTTRTRRPYSQIRTMEERHAIIQFTTFWRQQSHNPYLMGRPEVQVVLLSLAEVAQS